MNQSKKLTDGALLTGVYILLMLTTFIPVLSLISIFLLPVPFVLYTARHSYKPAILMFVAATVLTLLFATVFSLPIAVVTGLGGIMIGQSIYNNLSAYETWARGTLGFVIGLLFTFIYSQVLLSVNWITELQQMFSDSLEMTITMMQQVGITGEELAQMEELLQVQMEYMINLLPVWLAFSAIIIALIAQWISYKVMNRLDKTSYRFPPFRDMQLPASLVWIYLIVLLLSFIDMDPGSTFAIGILNIEMLIGMLLIIQGFSFIFFFAYHKNMSRAIPIISIIVTLLFPGFLIILVRILGIIDIGFKLRDRIEKKD